MSKALILIPCSATKKLSPMISYNQNINPLNGIIPLRNSLLQSLQQDHNFLSNITNKNGVLTAGSSTTIACELYDGKMYSVIKDKLRLIAQNNYPDIHILILSALYGIVQLNEKLQLYDLTMGSDISNQLKSSNKVYKIWKNSNISDLVYQYIITNEIDNVWNLLPNSGKTIYHSVLNKLWNNLNNNNITALHVFPGKEKNQCTGLYRGLWLDWMLDEFISNQNNYIMNSPSPPVNLKGIGTTFDYRKCI